MAVAMESWETFWKARPISKSARRFSGVCARTTSNEFRSPEFIGRREAIVCRQFTSHSTNCGSDGCADRAMSVGSDRATAEALAKEFLFKENEVISAGCTFAAGKDTVAGATRRTPEPSGGINAIAALRADCVAFNGTLATRA